MESGVRYPSERKRLLTLIGSQEASNQLLRDLLAGRCWKKSKHGGTKCGGTDGVLSVSSNRYNVKRCGDVTEDSAIRRLFGTSDLPSFVSAQSGTFLASPMDPPVLLAGRIVVPRCFLEHERIEDGRLIRPETEKVFPKRPDVKNLGRLCDTAELVFQCLMEVVSVELCGRAKMSVGNGLSLNWLQYRRANLESIICLLINGAGGGFTNKKSRLDNSMDGYRKVHAENLMAMEHYQVMMHNLMVYMFRYGIDQSDHGYFLSELPSKTVETAANTCFRRLKFPLWSSEYIDEDTGVLSVEDKMMCKGHNYHYALVYDRILFRGIEKEIQKRHTSPSPYLTTKQQNCMFDENKNRRFWLRDDLTVMINKLS